MFTFQRYVNTALPVVPDLREVLSTFPLLLLELSLGPGYPGHCLDFKAKQTWIVFLALHLHRALTVGKSFNL